VNISSFIIGLVCSEQVSLGVVVLIDLGYGDRSDEHSHVQNLGHLHPEGVTFNDRESHYDHAKQHGAESKDNISHQEGSSEVPEVVLKNGSDHVDQNRHTHGPDHHSNAILVVVSPVNTEEVLVRCVQTLVFEEEHSQVG